jgi:hypothetical protein
MAIMNRRKVILEELRRKALLEELRLTAKLNFWLGAVLGVLVGGSITMFLFLIVLSGA